MTYSDKIVNVEPSSLRMFRQEGAVKFHIKVRQKSVHLYTHRILSSGYTKQSYHNVVLIIWNLSTM